MPLKNKIFLWTSLILFPSLTFAADLSNCKDVVTRRANIQVQVLLARQGTNCFLTVTSVQKPTLIYRDYLFTSDGMFLVFNSLNGEDDADSTAAREFHFFPRVNSSPGFVWNDQERRLEVTHTNGDVFYFDYETAQIKGMGKGQVFVAPDIRKENRGGVEILSYQGLVLDVGFAVGHLPASSLSEFSIFKDAYSNTCKVVNHDIFVVTGFSDIDFKYPDRELKPFLKNLCPQLQQP